MDLALIVIVIAAVAVVGLVGLVITVRRKPVPRADHAHQAGPLDGAMDVVDRSVGMYVLRRLSHQPASVAAEADEPPALLSADEVAYRIGVADAPAPVPSQPTTYGPSPAPLPAAFVETTTATGPLTDAASIAAAARAAAAGHAQSRAAGGPVPISASGGAAVVSMGVVAGGARTSPGAVAPPKAPAAPRERLIRDAGIALIGLTIVGLVGFLILPQGPSGKPSGSVFSVVRASLSPRPTDSPTPPAATDPNAVTEPTATPDAATAAPTASSVAAPTAKPTKATPKPTPKPTPRPTPTPTPKPAPTPKPTPTPPPPHAVIGVSASCTSAGGSISFTGSGSTGDTTYLWDFDDGSTSSAANPSHTFSGGQSTYGVILIVDGAGGPPDSATVAIDVPCP